MKRLWLFLHDYRKESILAPLFKMLEAFFDLLVPIVVARIINIGIAGGDQAYILREAGVLILLAAAGMLSSFTAQYFAAKAAVGFGTKLAGSRVTRDTRNLVRTRGDHSVRLNTTQ